MSKVTREELERMEELLTSQERDKVMEGLELASRKIDEVGPENVPEVFGLVSSLFYLDPFDRPDLKECLDRAIEIVSRCGECTVPFLLSRLDDSDVKARMAVANALGKVGEAAIDPLLREWDRDPSPDRRSFVLYALGHVESPKIAKALPLALEAAESEDQGLRDTGCRALGRMLDAIPPGEVDKELVDKAVDVLRKNLGDSSSSIRAKATRSLGKIGARGHLDREKLIWLRGVLEHILGTDDAWDWDRAYVVRREAKEALQAIGKLL